MTKVERVKVGPDNYCEIIQLVPEEAVYAAAEAVYGCGFDGSPQKEEWLADFRKALTAARPYLREVRQVAAVRRHLRPENWFGGERPRHAQHVIDILDGTK